MRSTKNSTAPNAKQRALVIGVSDYPSPITKLPAVAADVREIARLLASKRGTFSKDSVVVLTDQQATKKTILDSLNDIFQSAASDEMLFVYLAGHGDVEGNDYFFVAHDTSIGQISQTGVPLATIKQLFESTKSKQVCLWLDFCHSGGILARRTTGNDDIAVIKRTLHVVQGQGKVIYAACSPTQSAFESQTVGHGLFTHALLEGIKGKAALNGEVTVSSLYDFIDRQVGSHRQRPEFFGHLQGRMVLMHDPQSSLQSTPVKSKKRQDESIKQTSATWILLGKYFFAAKSVRHNSDNTITLQVIPADSEQDAILNSLRPPQYGGSQNLAFACENDAHQVQVTAATSEVIGGKKTWTLTMSVDQQAFDGNWMESSISMNGKSLSADEIARLRATRILLNEPLSKRTEQRSFGGDFLLDSQIEGTSSRCPIKESPIRNVYAANGKHPAWKQFARLLAVYCLKASGTVESIFKLDLGAVRSGKLQVAFRGQRSRRYSNVEPAIIEFTGACPLE